MATTLVHFDLVAYLDGETAETFDWRRYLTERVTALAGTERDVASLLLAKDSLSAAFRSTLTANDPMLFALIYFRHHLAGKETADRITFSDFHLDLCRQRERWWRKLDTPQAIRDAYVAPRGTGKSTWLFLILPMWAAAHEHRKFAAAFADAGAQAEQHLENFKKELEENDLLGCDFPRLVKPRTKVGKEQVIANNRQIIQCSNGFVFAARGIEAASLGMKVGNLRPDLLIFDDVEPGEETYSEYQARKRLLAITDNAFPLNVNAQVVIAGTTTMAGSIIHQIIRVGMEEDDESTQWVLDENIRVHYYPPILPNDDGSERSLWPAKWSLEFLNSIRHTRGYAKNFANMPIAADGTYWGVDDFPVGVLRTPTRYLLSIDPAVTSKKKSDWTALAVVAYSPSEKRAQIVFTLAVRVSSERLKPIVVQICEAFPIRLILCESNQGGDLWIAALDGIPGVRLSLIHQSDPKEVRAARFLAHCQAVPEPRVLFGPDPVRDHPQLRDQCLSFPHGINDDLVDAAGTGAEYFLKWATELERAKASRSRPVRRPINYVGAS
jgi:phage terminase large subunit-like protein